jgi:hypothetical protein
MASVSAMAERVRADRRPAAADNPFLALQEQFSQQIVAGLDAWRNTTEALSEKLFMSIYGSPTLQAAVGIDHKSTLPPRKAAKSVLHWELIQKRIAELKSRIGTGGEREALIRSLLFAGMARAAVDERGFETVRQIRREMGADSLSAFKATVREQFYMLLLDADAALVAIPSMLPADAGQRTRALNLIKRILNARGEVLTADKDRLDYIAHLFGVDEQLSAEAAPSIGRADAREAEPGES